MLAPLNESRPAEVPLRPGRTWHVIARMVWSDREEWRPASTCRWTREHVLVQWWDDDGRDRITWLPAEDVRRAIVMPRTPVE